MLYSWTYFIKPQPGRLASSTHSALAAVPKLRRRLGQAARAKLERQYSLTAHCDGLLDIYSELLGRDVRKYAPERP